MSSNDKTEDDSWNRFEKEVYPRIWHSAYDLGVQAKVQGLPKVCNFVTKSGAILRVYKSAWEQGWEGTTTPGEFIQVENILSKLPLKEISNEDDH